MSDIESNSLLHFWKLKLTQRSWYLVAYSFEFNNLKKKEKAAHTWLKLKSFMWNIVILELNILGMLYQCFKTVTFALHLLLSNGVTNGT